MALPLLPVDLTWNAPAECPARDAVLDDVARILAQSRGTRAPATARADVSRDDRGRWHAALRVDASSAHSERALEAESCQAIATASALILAIAVEGGMPEATEPSAPSAGPALPPPPAASRRPSSQLVVAAGGVLDSGMFPGATPGAEGTLGWALDLPDFRVRALASASLFGVQTVQTPVPNETGRFTPFAVAMRGCVSLRRGAFDVGPCLGGELDVVQGEGGTPAPSYQPRTTPGSWASLLGSVVATWSFSRHVAVFLRADGLLPLHRPTFGIDSGGTQLNVYTPSSNFVRGALGAEARFF